CANTSSPPTTKSSPTRRPIPPRPSSRSAPSTSTPSSATKRRAPSGTITPSRSRASSSNSPSSLAGAPAWGCASPCAAISTASTRSGTAPAVSGNTMPRGGHCPPFSESPLHGQRPSAPTIDVLGRAHIGVSPEIALNPAAVAARASPCIPQPDRTDHVSKPSGHFTCQQQGAVKAESPAQVASVGSRRQDHRAGNSFPVIATRVIVRGASKERATRRRGGVYMLWCNEALASRADELKSSLRCVALLLFLLAAGCAGITTEPSGSPPPPQTGGGPTAHDLDPQQAERVRRIMAPLVSHMNNPRPLSQVRVRIMDDPQINAASAGGGEFYVTRGLLEKANDEHLRGVLAHELAHDDLGHVAKAQTLGAGLNIGMILLDQIFPGSGKLTPIAGVLVANSYSRQEEYEADRHGVDILTRAGYSKAVMVNTLTWLLQTSGASGGGMLATHPGTQERIDALKKL